MCYDVAHFQSPLVAAAASGAALAYDEESAAAALESPAASLRVD